MISGIATPRTKITKPSSNVPPVESTQSQRWIAFSGASSSSAVRRCDGERVVNCLSRCCSRLAVSRRCFRFLQPDFLLAGRLMIFPPNLGQIHSWFGQLHVHIFHLPDNDL